MKKFLITPSHTKTRHMWSPTRTHLKGNRAVTNELQNVADWLDETNLFINLKKGKTEFVLYGLHQNLQSNHQ